MIEIDGVLVDEGIFTTKFSCDYEKCQGACCWKSVEGVIYDGGGLQPDEKEEIDAKRNEIAPYCSYNLRKLVKKCPTYSNEDGLFTSMNKQQVCIFMNRTEHTCALKRAFNDGKLSFDIPKDCHLYPLLTDNHDGRVTLYIAESIKDFCGTAFDKGQKDNLLDFCKIPIKRIFGEKFWVKLKQEQQRFI